MSVVQERTFSKCQRLGHHKSILSTHISHLCLLAGDHPHLGCLPQWKLHSDIVFVAAKAAKEQLENHVMI